MPSSLHKNGQFTVLYINDGVTFYLPFRGTKKIVYYLWVLEKIILNAFPVTLYTFYIDVLFY